MIFLSAGIPAETQDFKQFGEIDVIAIREAVKALATFVIPKTQLVWGGHPAITPLIRFVLQRMDLDPRDHVTLYQSEYFRKDFPVENDHFESIVIVPAAATKEESLHRLRLVMIGDNNFSAGIFVGGLHGVEEEFSLFNELHPDALALPIATTGGAAKRIYESKPSQYPESLSSNYAYLSLYKDLLADKI